MPTAAQSALRIGHGVLRESLGERFTFDRVSFLGLVSEPIVTDRGVPRGMAFGQEHDFEIDCNPDDFIYGAPKAGSTIKADSTDIAFRVVGVKQPPGAHFITILVAQTTK